MDSSNGLLESEERDRDRQSGRVFWQVVIALVVIACFFVGSALPGAAYFLGEPLLYRHRQIKSHVLKRVTKCNLLQNRVG